MSFIHSDSNNSESIEHFMTKLMVYKLLLERGYEVSMEYYINGTGVMDVFDRTNGIVYEIEPTKQKSMQESKRLS
jgi:competence CoiA-like predicted nuclease